MELRKKTGTQTEMSKPKVPIPEMTVRTEKMVYGGQALARDDRFVVFVDDGLPHETLVVRPYKRKRKFAFARAIEVLDGAPERVAPDCVWFGQCGGCSFRHCRYDAQLRFKGDILAESLYGIPGVEGHTAPFAASPQINDYRGKMVFSFGTTLEGELRLGLHRRGSFIHIIPGDSCLLQSAASREIVKRVLSLANEMEIPAFHEIKKYHGLRTLMIRETHATGQRMVELSATTEYPGLAERLLHDLDDLADTLFLARDTHLHGPPQPGERLLLKGSGYMDETMNGLHFRIGPDTFFQNNVPQAARMFSRLQELAAREGKVETALDLFSGTGPIALHLASIATRVIGLETWTPSVFAAQENAVRNNIQNVEFRNADINAAPPADICNADLVAVDPPRPGMTPESVDWLLKLAPRNIFYVSCNPSTLARDLKLLMAGEAYRIAVIEPYDLFPHTFHMEALVHLVRA